MKYFLFFLVLIFVFANLFLIFPVAADSFKSVDKFGDTTVKLDNPLGNGVTPQTLIGKIIYGVLGIVGSLALVMFIYGGMTWMLAAGNAEAVTKGKNILIWATLGLVIIFTSYALVLFVLKDLLGALK